MGVSEKTQTTTGDPTMGRETTQTTYRNHELLEEADGLVTIFKGPIGVGRCYGLDEAKRVLDKHLDEPAGVLPPPRVTILVKEEISPTTKRYAGHIHERTPGFSYDRAYLFVCEVTFEDGRPLACKDLSGTPIGGDARWAALVLAITPA